MLRLSAISNVGTRAFHYLGLKNHLDLFWPQPGLRKIMEPNDFFTSSNAPSNLIRSSMDTKSTKTNPVFQNNKMISLPPPPPAPKGTNLHGTSTLKRSLNKSRTPKRMRICNNRSTRNVVKPVRIPIVIDIRKVGQEMGQPFPQANMFHSPPPPQTLSKRLLDLSKDATFILLNKAKSKSIAQLRKIELPDLDARKMKKIAAYGSPFVTTLAGYLYGKFN